MSPVERQVETFEGNCVWKSLAVEDEALVVFYGVFDMLVELAHDALYWTEVAHNLQHLYFLALLS